MGILLAATILAVGRYESHTSAHVSLVAGDDVSDQWIYVQKHSSNSNLIKITIIAQHSKKKKKKQKEVAMFMTIIWYIYDLVEEPCLSYGDAKSKMKRVISLWNPDRNFHVIFLEVPCLFERTGVQLYRVSDFRRKILFNDRNYVLYVCNILVVTMEDTSSYTYSRSLARRRISFVIILR